MSKDDTIKPGDRFLVEVEVEHVTGTDPCYVACRDPEGRTIAFAGKTLLASKRLPRAIKVGDPVNDTEQGENGKVLWIDENGALVEDGEGLRWYADIADLTLVEPSHD